jgi:hypothetical protein
MGRRSWLKSYRGDISFRKGSYHGIADLNSGECRYEGELVDGLTNGRGSLVIDSDHAWCWNYKSYFPYRSYLNFTGNWFNGYAHGPGKLDIEVENMSASFSGEFIEGSYDANGSGKLTVHDSNGTLVYVGELEEGVLHGKGTLAFSDLHRLGYICTFRPLLREDFDYTPGDPRERLKLQAEHEFLSYYYNVSLTWTNGDKYIGQSHNGKLDGVGTLRYKDGRKYIGTWINGKKHLAGTMSYGDNDAWNRREYRGRWSYDQEDGFGWVILNTGEEYEGEWINGIFKGTNTEGKELTIDINEIPAKN